MARTPRTVLFVGAGASRACGYPLTGDILPQILERLASGNFDDEHIDFHSRQFKRFLARLIPKSTGTRLPQITELLSVIDYCLESGEELISPSDTTLKLTDARWLLERSISRVIRKVHKSEVRPREIARWVGQRRRAGAEVTIVSTNYDFSLDRVLFQELKDWSVDYLKMDFGFTWRDPDGGELVHPAANPKLRLYKLHGSLNWLTCARCGSTYVNFLRTLVTLADDEEGNTWSTCHCGFRPLRAVLVAPSLVRRYRDRNLLNVWRSTYEALRLADELLFVGYSLPAEDVGIRALLMRAMFSRDRSPTVRVVSSGHDALERYRQIFPACQYTGDGLRSFLDDDCCWKKPPEKRRRRTKRARRAARKA